MNILFGGSFDPVHNGHLRVATELSELFDGAQVSLIPCRDPVHKPRANIDAESRYRMLVAATEESPSLVVSRIELDAESDSYTINTLQALNSNEGLILAVGTDSALNMPTWHHAEVYKDLCNVVVLERPDYSNAQIENNLKSLGFSIVSSPDALRSAKTGLALIARVTQLQISSSDIRQRVAENKSIRYLVPDAVQGIICDNDFYQI
ncbi:MULTISPECIES: nicotinate (nicotinamide) nucleotide adenylyltransferase [unclassified Oleiphilus]|uniref:nicotinate (nicotinamide) nucleotide adenylyltransferase n=1 Tax=unclassified Oleiphilus TaxID=2631174 RepID=UPI0007C31999|nr:MULTISPECIES: nicotinate (nicotinamide) nucleotide adenylyltransferase [unclassified Oleiphilus]MCH2159377.1 nicotinate (nicotinamide) nucleotide adenylyltransferase [Oleiphilaceae bacterium]KZY62139.1 hypothetical protein A3738_21630 [Oleiphilus sp. HI0066]KZY66262.1 hypothetical protein A3738_06970 [Oleiphilus sp. HI0066]KZY67491.1 hypothetical protein A3739_21575 [Oleiphilus sp. HI0067]KZY69659.1 hypothetical protein A3739_08375 [Oleiphilus sp. HI0067]